MSDVENNFHDFEVAKAIQIPVPENFKGFLALLSTRAQGDMTYETGGINRGRLYLEHSINAGKVYSLPLSHSMRVVRIFEGESPDTFRKRLNESGGADGGILTKRGLYATVTVADCMPIWLFDNRTGNVALLHSGWKGTGILEHAIREMIEDYSEHVDARNMYAVFGPCIGPCCYNVPFERAEYFMNRFGKSSVVEAETGDGLRYYLNLRRANESLAERLSIGSITTIDHCTACSNELGSYRREGPKTFTRMLAIVGSKPLD
jgi:YfiH family protein